MNKNVFYAFDGFPTTSKNKKSTERCRQYGEHKLAIDAD